MTVQVAFFLDICVLLGHLEHDSNHLTFDSRRVA